MTKEYVPLDTLPEGFHAPYREYVEQMVADGWTLNHSPWHQDSAGKVFRHYGDRSVTLTRDDFTVWFVDRDLNPDNHEDCVPLNKWNVPTHWHVQEDGSVLQTCKNPTRHETWTAAWANDGMQAIDLPAEYSWQALLDAKGYCKYCQRVVGRENLRSISFAGKICGECDDSKPEIRKEAEYPGWTN